MVRNFNIMVDDKENITVIDFPQMVSVKHENASYLFQRDVDCILRFFNRKVKYSPDEDELGAMVAYPTLEDVLENMNLDEGLALDKQLAASGFKRRLKEKKGKRGEGSDSDGEYSEDGEDSGEADADDDFEFIEDKDRESEVSKLKGELAGMSVSAPEQEQEEEEREGGELDGLLSFASGYNGGGEDQEETAFSSRSEAKGVPKRTGAAKGGFSTRGKKRFEGKNKGKSNANKDKSGRRHDGVKHKFSKSDY